MTSPEATQFIQQGFTTLEPSDSMKDWARSVLRRAQNEPRKKTGTPGWHINNGEFQVEMPRDTRLQELLTELLKEELRILPNVAQLSSLADGYTPVGLNRHVDGAYADELSWFGLLVGILLVEVKSGEDNGALLVWPESHRVTQSRFDGLERPVTRKNVREAILSQEGINGEPLEITGPPGTVVVLDHRTYHGMRAHQQPDFVRHMIYFRLPDMTSIPEQVVDGHHFLRHG
ncbi:hypothetical protein [Variovorax sp. AFSI2.2]|uniref:hypothetical protein n=1 Tax=Variovorax sp. AFSI2.2 TaxID=3384160 RepID=UPI003EBE4AA2